MNHCSLLDRYYGNRRLQYAPGGLPLEETYKNHIIVVTATGPNLKSKWIPKCVILTESREPVKDIEWDLDYDTSDEAHRIGLLLGKKWIDQELPAVD